jgi:hypothetical protein
MPRPLLLILLVYFVAGLAYITNTPALEISDEPRHYAMVEWLAQGKGLPVQRIGQTDADAPYGQEGSQPPLYYALMALVAQPFDRGDYAQVWRFNPHSQHMGRADATTNRTQMLHTPAQDFPWRKTTLAIMTMRALGLLMGGAAVACAYLLALEIGDRRLETRDSRAPTPVSNSPISILAAAFVAFNPMFLHIMGSVNNDTLATACSSLALLLGARMIKRGATLHRALWLGIVLGCAALSKVSGLALVLVVPSFVLFSELLKMQKMRRWRDEGMRKFALITSPPHPLTTVLSMLIPTLAISGWWYARNVVLYGDFTGTATMAAIAGPRVPPLGSLLELLPEWRSFLTAYWGMFGALNIPMNDWVYTLFYALMVVAGVGLILEIGDWRLSVSKSQVSHLQSLISLMLLTAITVACVALIKWTSMTLASQGRLLFPLIAAIAVFLARGVLRICRCAVGSRQPSFAIRHLPFAICVLMGLLATVVPFVYLRPAYAKPQLLRTETQLPKDIVKTELFFGDKIRWLGYTVAPSRVRVGTGELVQVTLFWQAQKPIPKNYSLGLRLFGNTGLTDTEVLVLDTYPGGGMWPTELWQTGEIIVDQYQLSIPHSPTLTALLPTVLKLDVGFYELDGFKFITDTRDAQGNASGRQRYAVTSVGLPQVEVHTALALGSVAVAKLIAATATRNGNEITFATRWQSTQDVHEDYTMFVQLFDAQGQHVQETQADGPVQKLPLRYWRAGDVVTDTRTLRVPAHLPAGQYTVRFGFYKPVEPYARMPAFDPSGQPLPDNAMQVQVTSGQ